MEPGTVVHHVTIADLLARIAKSLNDAKEQAGRSDEGRKAAVLLTDVEKLTALVNHYDAGHLWAD